MRIESGNVQGIKKSYIKELPTPSDRWPSGIKEVEGCIHRYLFDQKLSVNWIKKECHIDGKSFSVRFKWCMGYHPREYIIHHRIEASKRLLVQTPASTTQIALAVGYALLSAFCNTFKNKEGCRPSEWRRQHRN